MLRAVAEYLRSGQRIVSTSIAAPGSLHCVSPPFPAGNIEQKCRATGFPDILE